MKTIELIPLPKSVNAQVEIPGSKSYTNRALFIASMTGSRTKILNPLISDDTKTMINCLKRLGIKVKIASNTINVTNNITSVKNLSYGLNVNQSGTTIRFMLALSTIIPGVKTLYGKKGLNKRPIGNLVKGLRKLGANIEYLGQEGYPPVKILSSKLQSGTIKIKGDISSQYISALLMISPLIGKITIKVTGDQVSKPYIDMTIDTMEKFGVKVSNKEYKTYTINPQKYIAKQYVIEGDLSSASYFLAIAALTKSTITLENINPKSKQADISFLKILEDMGNKISYGKNNITITGKGGKPVNVDMQDCPDQIPTTAVLVAFASGVSKISGISSLRIKETDRVFALQQELKKMGIKTTASKNTLTIWGGNPKACNIKTYGDHRMAMSFAIAGAKLANMKILNPDVVSKTFPQFWQKLRSLGIKTAVRQYKNITLIGMRRSGKTTIAKILSRKLDKPYLELDELITREAGCSISQIVAKHGWQFFRKLESDIVTSVAWQENKIISTGGGVILNPDNINALKKKGALIWLKTSLPQLIQRIQNDKSKPPLTKNKDQKAEIAEVLKLRKDLYEKAADLVVETDDRSGEEIADQIIQEVSYGSN